MAAQDVTNEQSNPSVPIAWGAVIIYLLAMALNGFDGTVINPSLPHLAADMNVSGAYLGAVEWTYLIASASALPAAGYLGSRWSTRRVFTACLTGFSVGLLIASLAPTFSVLVIARVIQGISSGLLVPVGLALVYRGATGEQRLRITRITLLPLTIAPMLGPVFGGFLAQHWGWRAAYVFMLPISVVTTLAAFLVLGYMERSSQQDVTGVTNRQTDANQLPFAGIGGSLLAGCLAVGGLSAGGPLIVTSIQSGGVNLVMLLAGVVLIIVCGIGLAAIMKASALKGMDVGPWDVPTFRTGSSFVAVATGGLTAFLFVIPLVMAANGHTASEIGMVMFPETFGLLIGGQIVVRVKKLIGVKTALMVGPVVAAAIAIIVLLYGPQAPWAVTAGLMMCFGITLSQPVLMAQVCVFGDVPDDRMDGAMPAFMVYRSLVSAWVVVVAACAFGAWGVHAATLVVTCGLVGSLVAGMRLPAAEWKRLVD